MADIRPSMRPSTMGFDTLDQWLAWQETLHPSAIDLGLDRVRRTLDRLEWRRPSCPVITIGGTNGKGSCAALASAILSAAGYRTGVFTSPHLIRYQERITIAGQEISAASLIAAFERIDAARGADTLTFFEFNTLAALLAFETAGLDAIVLEVGMGGRLDAVNVVDADVALVTSIALDHCEWLGADLESIGREKAGVYRAGRPAVFGSRFIPASVEETATAIGADLLRLGYEFDWAPARNSRENQGRGNWNRWTQARWDWRGRASTHDDLPPSALGGGVQYDNAASVLCAMESLVDRLPVSRDSIERGLQDVRLPGRFQRIGGEVEWILDVAHNKAAARTLAAQLAAQPISGRTIAVCGVLGDKDVEGVGAALLGAFDLWVTAGLSGARAIASKQLAERLQRIGANVAEIADDVPAACAAARALARPGDRIVVFGSFLTVGPALQELKDDGDS